MTSPMMKKLQAKQKYTVPYISDQRLYWRYSAIQPYLQKNHTVTIGFNAGYLCFDKEVYIAKKSQKFRLKGWIDWAWYTPKTIANALDNNTMEDYYKFMLNDSRSDPNFWKDPNFEVQLKTYYAARAGRNKII